MAEEHEDQPPPGTEASAGIEWSTASSPPAVAPEPGDKDAPDAPSTILPSSPRAGALSRREGIAVLYALVGALLLYAAGRVPSEDVTLAVGVGAAAPAALLDPPNTVLGLGLAVIAAAAAAIALERRGRRGAGALLVVATILFVPLVLVLALALSDARSTNVVPLFVESLRLGTPIALGALAGLWCERSGVVNIGIEGMMLAGAGVGFVVYAVAGEGQASAWLAAGVVGAVLVGGLLGLLHALLSVTFRTDQIIAGVAINLLAIGLTSFLRRQVILPTGVQSATTLPTWRIPVLSDIPLVGSALFTGKPIFFAMPLLFLATSVVLFRTPWGLRVRSVGEKPGAADSLGVDVGRTRYQAVVLGGLIAGLAGAWFSLETVGSFDDLMTNGKGFIALAALIFGKWRPWGAFGGAMLFGFADALGTRIQFLDVRLGDVGVPSQFLQILPFVVTIVVLAGAIGRAVPPAAVGIPFDRKR